MGLVKSELIKKIKKNYPNIYTKDLAKILDIFLNEIKISLKNDLRVELRGFATWSVKKMNSRKARNPKTGESIIVPSKRSINFKMTKELIEKINNEKI